MLKRTAWALVACFWMSGFAVAEQPQPKNEPRALGDAELDAITAGAISFDFTVVLNPGNADVFKLQGDRFHCVNCLGATGNTETSVTIVRIKDNGNNVFKCNGAAPAC